MLAWTQFVAVPEPRVSALLPHGGEHVVAVAYPPHGHLLLVVVDLNRMYTCKNTSQQKHTAHTVSLIFT